MPDKQRRRSCGHYQYLVAALLDSCRRTFTVKPAPSDYEVDPDKIFSLREGFYIAPITCRGRSDEIKEEEDNKDDDHGSAGDGGTASINTILAGEIVNNVKQYGNMEEHANSNLHDQSINTNQGHTAAAMNQLDNIEDHVNVKHVKMEELLLEHVKVKHGNMEEQHNQIEEHVNDDDNIAEEHDDNEDETINTNLGDITTPMKQDGIVEKISYDIDSGLMHKCIHAMKPNDNLETHVYNDDSCIMPIKCSTIDNKGKEEIEEQPLLLMGPSNHTRPRKQPHSLHWCSISLYMYFVAIFASDLLLCLVIMALMDFLKVTMF